MEKSILYKRIRYGKNWINYLNNKEENLVKTIVNADKETLNLFKRKYSNLYFMIEFDKALFGIE